MDKKVLSVTQLSKCLGIGMNAAYSLVKSTDFPCLHIGKRILIPTSELEKWLSKKSADHTA